MELSNNSLKQVALTPTKLNFYLAQSKRNKNKPYEESNSLASSRHDIQKSKIIPHIKEVQDLESSIILSPPKGFTQKLHNKENFSPSKEDRIQYNDRRNHSLNVYQNYDNQFSTLPICQKDSLDSFMTQSIHYGNLTGRNHQKQTDKFTNNQNNSLKDIQSFKLKDLRIKIPMDPNANVRGSPKNQKQYIKFNIINNHSEIIPHSHHQDQANIFSPKSILKQKENLEYFNYSNSYSQSIPKKRVNWRKPTRKMTNKNIQCLKMVDGFWDISNQLSRITYELNKNTQKLNELNKVYEQIKKVIPSPQQRLKRANLKYAKCDLNEEYVTRPQIQYKDEIYKDPKYLIWKPTHQSNQMTKFS